MDTLTRLKKVWKEKHFKHLLDCLKYCQSYYEDTLVYHGVKDGALLIDEEVITQENILEILCDYYLDNKQGYETPFGDVLYLFFTDLVEEDVDILEEIDRSVA